MSFARSKKITHEQIKYNPPPGYYENLNIQKNHKSIQFSKDQRFKMKIENHNPGPGAYMNNQKQEIKKRLLQQANKKQFRPFNHNNNSNSNSDIKISSIPSIPKKSTTRVYQQLAPGILILHQQQHQNPNIGPGSYNITTSQTKKKTPATRIYPQPKKRLFLQQQQLDTVKIPTLAEQLRQQKRLMYKQNLYKSSTVNKNDINSTDLCLETIILRQKLLRGDDVPPPGAYYNQQVYSSFKVNYYQMDKPAQLQALGGKEERFKEMEVQNLGPGSYNVKEEVGKKGGVIGKDTKKQTDLYKKINQPGPGAYQLVSMKAVKQQPKGNYPPIFGSGCKRFLGGQRQIQQLPGPGSYKLDTKKKKKVKYIKVRRDFYDTQRNPNLNQTGEQLKFSNPLGSNDSSNIHYHNQNNNDKSVIQKNTYYSLPHHSSQKQKPNHFFKSKVQRFLSNSSNNNTMNNTGPGQYETNDKQFVKNTFNRKKKQGYLGDKSQRFDDVMIRPNLGPGTYY